MYLWLKVAHLLAVVIFLGNILTGLFWHSFAARTRDPRLLAHTMRGIIASDRLFTIPGVVFIILAGVGTAMAGRLPLIGTGWILWSFILFGISGIAFVLRVAPLQQELRALAERGAQSEPFDYAGYAALARRWEAWGAVALLTPFAALVLMILKPVL